MQQGIATTAAYLERYPPGTIAEYSTAKITNRIKVGVEDPTDGLETMFNKLNGFEAIVLEPSLEVLPDLDLIAFSGGADINPTMYKEARHPHTHYSDLRDVFSVRLHEHYAHLPKVGVCRGAQFLCVRNGGALNQHIPDHNGGTHEIIVIGANSTKMLMTNSVHHQSCLLRHDMKLLALSRDKVDWVEGSHGRKAIPQQIVEGFYIPYDHALCVQFHPEYGHKESRKIFFELFWEHFPEFKERLSTGYYETA